MAWLERLKSFGSWPGKEGRSTFGRQMLLLLALGVGLLLFNGLCSPAGDRADPVEYTPFADESPAQEQQLQELAGLLNQIRGVSNATIYLTLEHGGRAELVADREESRRVTVEGDREGGTREVRETTSRDTHVILRDPQGRETPLVVQENQPRYRGVLVVADGVDDPAVKAQVVEALRAILALPYHRISVLPRE